VNIPGGLSMKFSILVKQAFFPKRYENLVNCFEMSQVLADIHGRLYATQEKAVSL
jgi:hypothetical protein